MSSNYYLVDTQKKIFFNLGDGRWYQLNDEFEILQDLECLILYLLDDYFTGKFQNELQRKETIEYVTKYLAPILYDNFKDSKVNDLVVFNDCGDDLIIIKSKKYKCIGSRYDLDNPEKYEKEIKFLNRHLNDSSLSHLYDPENYKNYQEFNKY